MATLTVDRLHARYHLDRPADAARLDACLRRVADEALSRALVRLPDTDGHVCLERLTVAVRLHPGADPVRSWAEQIVTTLREAVGSRAGAVVYPRTLDALVDLLVSVAQGDLSRAWAWAQVGLLPAGVDPSSPDAAVHALGSRRDLACAALVAAAVRGPVPLTAAGWAAVARDVAGLVPAGSRPGDATRRPGPPTVRVLATPVARRLPEADIAALPSADRLAVARLLLLCSAPALACSTPMLLAVDAALTRPGSVALPPERFPGAGDRDPAMRTSADHRVGVPGPRGGAGSADGGAPTDRVATHPPARPIGEEGGTEDGRGVGGDPDPAPDGAAARAGDASPAAGVLFLIPVVTALELPDSTAAAAPTGRPFDVLLAWLAARLGELPLDDPAVRVLAGQPTERIEPPGPDDEPTLAVLAADVRGWLLARLGLAPDDDLRWLWRRPARIAAEPGWVEATFDLDDVDTRIRGAGLDLDPGFVWWLGAVVRYRYV
jgi:hypothetical protein